MIKINFYDKEYNLSFQFEEYQEGGRAVRLVDENQSVLCVLSVWFQETKRLPRNAFYLKAWSENAPIAEQLIEQNIIQKLHENDAAVVRSGFIESEAYVITEELQAGIKAYIGTLKSDSPMVPKSHVNMAGQWAKFGRDTFMQSIYKKS